MLTGKGPRPFAVGVTSPGACSSVVKTPSAALRRHFPAGTTLIMANQCLAIPSQVCLSASLWATFAIRSHSAALARYSSFLLIDYPNAELGKWLP